MLLPGELFHVGVVVPDLEQALEELGRSGFEWARPLAQPVEVIAPDGRRLTVTGALTYSLVPPRLELIQAAEGTPWTPEAVGSIHHLGYWVDELAPALADARELGWSLEWTGAGEDGRPARFAYLQLPGSRLRVELVDRTAIGAGLERWWQGGAYRP